MKAELGYYPSRFKKLTLNGSNESFDKKIIFGFKETK